jgi:hypothetical protein
MADFSCIPCSGLKCFPRELLERKACSPKPHACPARLADKDWQCRCCVDCTWECLNQLQALEHTKDANGK